MEINHNTKSIESYKITKILFNMEIIVYTYKRMSANVCKTKKTFLNIVQNTIIRRFKRGSWRIRTAVIGFADRCLATRPTNLDFESAKIV